MTIKTVLAVPVLLVFAFVLSAGAQVPSRMKMSGLIDSSGPWKIAGEWSVHLEGNSGKADFNATLNMLRSDYWLIQTSTPNNPAGINYHTHHVTVEDADVTTIANGIQLTGMATITANGSVAPVSPSPVTITITGGDALDFSNISITFGGKAASHFGSDPLTGMVRIPSSEAEHRH